MKIPKWQWKYIVFVLAGLIVACIATTMMLSQTLSVDWGVYFVYLLATGMAISFFAFFCMVGELFFRHPSR